MHRKPFWNRLILFSVLSVALSAALSVMLLSPATAFAQERVCVNTKIANLRSGPGTDNQILWQVEKYHPLIILKKKGNWYQIKDFEGDKAWLHKSLIGKIEAVITIKKKCNVRSGPGTGNAILFTTERGVPFKVIKKKGNWLNIKHADGDTGWIHKSLVW
ncbi:MAG: hypothetical protein D3926_17055 [Desulfobacteraceae bacterium]|nr:MAG: hypothetical protein D3926_17055 [Desulfobacteraceae bacterium]